MKVLAVTNMYPTEKLPQFGIFVREQVDSIRDLGHDVDVLFMNGREGIARHKAYGLAFPRLWLTLHNKRYDVIHAHYVFSGIVARAQKSAPLVLTHHGIEVVHPWQGPMCRVTRKWADRTIVVAPWMVPVLGLPDVDIIPCGVDLSIFAPVDRQEARRQLGLDPDRRYILFAGNTWDKVKRFELIRQASALVCAQMLDTELIFVEGQPHHRVPLYMFAADALVLASVGEGSPQVVKEAMACGLPIVSTDIGDAWDVIQGCEGCYQTSDDPADIAHHLRLAISPPHRTDGRDRVERFSVPTIAREVVEVYEKAIAQRARHGRLAGRASGVAS